MNIERKLKDLPLLLKEERSLINILMTSPTSSLVSKSGKPINSGTRHNSNRRKLTTKLGKLLKRLDSPKRRDWQTRPRLRLLRMRSQLAMLSNKHLMIWKPLMQQLQTHTLLRKLTQQRKLTTRRLRRLQPLKS